MVERQLRRRGVSDERVLEAMGRVPRESFLPEAMRNLAYEDGALPIGHGQTMSQPFIVASICALLALEGYERVLDVGTGPGYQAAVLAELAEEVITVERIPELAAAARAALEATGHGAVEVRVGDGSVGVSHVKPGDTGFARSSDRSGSALRPARPRRASGPSAGLPLGAGARPRRQDRGRASRAGIRSLPVRPARRRRGVP